MHIHSSILKTSTHSLHRFSALPKGPPIARVILLHGYGDHAGKYFHFLSWMAEHNVAASAVDFRGHGRSTGPVAHVKRWEEYLEDLAEMLGVDGGFRIEDRRSKIEDRQENPPSSVDPQSLILDPRFPLPTFFVAHSHGALIAVIAALRGMLDGVAGVVMSAPYLELKIPVSPAKRFFAAMASRVSPGFAVKSGIDGAMLTRDPELIEINKTDPYCPGIATPRWFTTARRMQAEARASASLFKLPLLMLVAGDDVIADSRASVAFFEQAGSADKQIKLYPEHRHELLRDIGREEIFQTTLDWMIQRRTNA